MIQITPHMKIFLCVEPVDFRAGIDGFARISREKLEKDPFSGALFVFRNRSRTSLKILTYDGQGFWMCQKRLSKGKFIWWPDSSELSSSCVDAHELQQLIWNGIVEKCGFVRFWKKIA